MSDEESYEYEYDDDAMEEEFEYTDDEEQVDDTAVELENNYYNAKGMRDDDVSAAVAEFEKVISLETKELAEKESSHKYSQWSFKALKQLVKLQLRLGNGEEVMRHYNRLLECIGTGDISPNATEKGINGMLDRVASLLQGPSTGRLEKQNNSSFDPQQLALSVYDATLRVFHPSKGTSPNERLWFKANLKYGQLLYEMNETAKLQNVLRDLKMTQLGDEDHTSSSSTASTQSMEVYALQIQLYSKQKDNKKLREVFNKAMSVRGGIPHPRTLALIQELGGKSLLASKDYDKAQKTFFQAFKSYDEAGDSSRLRCLKYLVLASMLHQSSINPFDSQEARPYRDDPEIKAMTGLVHAFQENKIQEFESILRKNQRTIMDDEFIRDYIEDLLRTIRTQVLRSVIRPYKKISLAAISRELNNIPIDDVESLLVGLIVDGKLDGQIDAIEQTLIKMPEGGQESQAALSRQDGTGTNHQVDLLTQKYDSMMGLAEAIDDIASSVINSRQKDLGMSRSMIIH